MDETAPAASSALESKESLMAPAFGLDFFPFGSATPRGGDLMPSGGGFHTVIGITVNGCSTAAPERPFAFTSGLEGGSKVKTRGDDASSGSRAGEGETPPISEPQPGVKTPAQALGQEKEETPPSSEPRPGAAIPAPALE